MFSTMPRMESFTVRQKLMDLRTSARATSCGVVTMIARASGICWATVSGSSPVPGGESITRKSSSAPVDVGDELPDGGELERPAPDDGVVALGQEGLHRNGDQVVECPHRFELAVEVDVRHPGQPSMRGTSGPCRSTSMSPTLNPPGREREREVDRGARLADPALAAHHHELAADLAERLGHRGILLLLDLLGGLRDFIEDLRHGNGLLLPVSDQP